MEKVHFVFSVYNRAHLGWGLKPVHKWQYRYKAAGSKQQHERETKTMKFPSGLVLHLCEDKFQATICTFKIHVEVISVRAENATLSWKNAKYLRTLGRVSHRCHDELDAPQQLHPPAESHLQILWQTDRQKDFRGQNATDNLCINPHPQPHSPPPSIITSYICPRCISTLTHSEFLTYYTICFSSGGAWQGRLIFFFSINWCLKRLNCEWILLFGVCLPTPNRAF